MKFFRIFAGALGVFCIVFSSLFGYKRIGKDKEIVIYNEYQGLLSIWHIDGFEGGKGSRRDFLMSVARDFEKEYQGVPVMVVSHTIESANNALSNGQKPDLISFSNGVEVGQLAEIKTKLETPQTTLNGKQYAIPWCRGGYVLVAKKDNGVSLDNSTFEEIIISNDLYTQPFCSLVMENITCKKFSYNTPLNAYIDFINKKGVVFLATQRDVIRLQNRGIDVAVRPITEFNDLYQYISYFDNGKDKNTFSQRFIELLVSQKWQQRLDDIGMMSEFFRVNFENEHLKEMQKIKAKKSLSCFFDKAYLTNLKEMSIKAVGGDENSILKLKKLIV